MNDKLTTQPKPAPKSKQGLRPLTFWIWCGLYGSFRAIQLSRTIRFS